MELGGKGPAIILKDTNIQNAAKLCAMGALLHHGQVRFSTERIIIERAVYDEVNTTYGNCVGFAATKCSADHAHEVVKEAKKNGAKVLVGDDNFIGDTGVSLRPTIITGIKPADRIRDAETFGLSSTVYVVEDADEALKFANNSLYGLNASIRTRGCAAGAGYGKEDGRDASPHQWLDGVR
jgi:acyl-CoA reductase-like NAD-dependent aldehyde dehydrogenase